MPASFMCETQPSALRTSNHSRGASQCSAPPYSTGSLGKRWISSVVRIPDRRRARTARPLSAPKSKARYGLAWGWSGIGRNVVGVLRSAFFRDALQITALTERFHRIFGQSLGSTPLLNCRADIRRESILQRRLSIDQIALLLGRGQFLQIHER